MTVAFQPRTNGPAHRGQSRFFASPPRAPRHRHARPAKRLAGRKTAPGIFFVPVPKTRPETVTQVTNPHQERATYVFVFVSGCAVGPNSGYYSIGYGASATVFDGKGYSVSVGASLVQPVSDPSLGSYLTLTFSLSSLTSGTGIAAFWGTGPSGGLQGSAPETGVGAPASHTEGGLVWGGGASYSTDSDANSTQVSPPTFPSLQGGHEGEFGDGVAAYHASGTSNAYTIAIPIPQGPAPVIGPLPGLYYNPAYGPPGF